MMTSDPSSRWEALIDREAQGEALSADERAFVQRYASEHPEAATELSVLRGLQGALRAQAPQQPGDRELILGVFEHEQSARRAKLRRAAVASGLAVAAALALWFVRPLAEPTSRPVASLKTVPEAVARLDVVSPGVTLDGARVLVGARVGRGQSIETGAQSGCLRLDRDVRACLAPGSLARLAGLGNDVLLVLERGSVAADLGKQAAGTSFAVQTGTHVVRAIGTRFGIAMAESAVLRVVAGTVLVTGDGAAYHVSAPDRTELGTRRITPLSAAEQQATNALLAPLLGESSALAPVEPWAAPVPAPSAERTLPSAAPGPSASAESAGALLAYAREQRASGSMKGAVKAYRRLIVEHPASAEALTARVALGQLELSSLGDPGGALAHFSEYLKRGGPLEQEARYGQVRALAALSRPAQEKRAIEAFLAKYPRAMQAALLRERLKTLGGATLH